jgi:hypothetical protein
MKSKINYEKPIDKDPDYINPADQGELVKLLRDLQLRFVPNTDLHNKLAKAIQLAK